MKLLSCRRLLSPDSIHV